MGGPFPQLETITSDNDQIIQSLIQFLEQRINKRNILRTDLQKKRETFNFSKFISQLINQQSAIIMIIMMMIMIIV